MNTAFVAFTAFDPAIYENCHTPFWCVGARMTREISKNGPLEGGEGGEGGFGSCSFGHGCD